MDENKSPINELIDSIVNWPPIPLKILIPAIIAVLGFCGGLMWLISSIN